MVKEFLSDNRQHLYQNVAARCAHQLKSIIEEDGKASMIVPGGTTPAPVFELLSKMPLAWNKVSIVPSDERWIATDQKQSNQYLIEQTLLINHASVAHLVPLKNSAKTPLEGEKLTEDNLQRFNQPHAVSVLGMGNDGHFASLFPGSPQLQEALDINNSRKCTAIDATGCPVAGDYTDRMSLTMTEIIHSKLIIIIITGQQKLDIIRNAARGQASPDVPVSLLISQNKTPVEIYYSN